MRDVGVSSVAFQVIESPREMKVESVSRRDDTNSLLERATRLEQVGIQNIKMRRKKMNGERGTTLKVNGNNQNNRDEQNETSKRQ